MGSPKLIDTLNNTHKSFTYRLGMSATPEREYGDEGNLLIKNELGDTFYKYELEDAIKDGVLCEVDYAY